MSTKTNTEPRVQVGAAIDRASPSNNGLIYASEASIGVYDQANSLWRSAPVLGGTAAGAINRGTGTLVLGTKNVVVVGMTGSSTVMVTLTSMVPGAGNLTRAYKAVPGTGSFDVTALLADGTINTLDTSSFAYIAIS